MADTDVVKYGMFRLFLTIKFMFLFALEHPSELLNTKEHSKLKLKLFAEKKTSRKNNKEEFC